MSGEPVFINVYDLFENKTHKKTNNGMKTIGMGGLYHAAVELFGVEYSFGYKQYGNGIYAWHPKENDAHSYRETIPVGYTTLTHKEVKKILKEMSPAWEGPSYDLLSRNCCTFCQVFLPLLGTSVEPFPGWINRTARAGALCQTTAITVTETITSTSKAIDQKLGVTTKVVAVDERFKISEKAKQLDSEYQISAQTCALAASAGTMAKNGLSYLFGGSQPSTVVPARNTTQPNNSSAS